MKKVFTLVVVSLMAVTLFGADKYIRISEMSVTGTTYDWSSDNEVKAKNTNVYVEVPTSTPAGALTVYGSSGKTDRFLYVYGNGGTVKDTNRGMVMVTGGASVDFYADRKSVV